MRRVVASAEGPLRALMENADKADYNIEASKSVIYHCISLSTSGILGLTQAQGLLDRLLNGSMGFSLEDYGQECLTILGRRPYFHTAVPQQEWDVSGAPGL